MFVRNFFELPNGATGYSTGVTTKDDIEPSFWLKLAMALRGWYWLPKGSPVNYIGILHTL